MARQWIPLGQGVRYYEHPTDTVVDPEDRRKRRPARVYALTYKYQGKTVSEGIGPEPEVSEAYAMEIAALLAANRKQGLHPATYAELKTERNQEYEAQQAQAEADRLNTFGAFFLGPFLTHKRAEVAAGNLTDGTLADTISRYNFWMKPALDEMRFDDEDPEHDPTKTPEPTGPAIAALTFAELEEEHFQRLAAKMRRKVCKVVRVRDYEAEDARKAAGLEPKRTKRLYRHERVIEERRTLRLAQAVRAVCHEVWDYAVSKGATKKEFPGKKILKGTPRNERTRFYTPEEAGAILSALKKRSIDVYHHAMISLYTGLRAGQVLKLRWQDIKEGVARDTKNRESVPVPFLRSVDDLQTVIAEREKMFPNRRLSHYVFPKQVSKAGDLDPTQHPTQVSATFKRTIEDIRINEEIADRRGKGVFHTLRHTFASWLVQDGEPLFKVGKYMGQKTPRMTDRYSHLAPEHYESAANRLNARKIEIKE